MLSDKTLEQHLDKLDYYALLGVPRDATAERVRDAFHQLALRYHPDQHVGEPAEQQRCVRIFKRGTEAYRVLLDPELRGRYDASLGKGDVRLRPQDQRRVPGAAAPRTISQVVNFVPAASAKGANAVAAVAPVTAVPEAPLPSDVRPLFEQAVAALKRGDVKNAKAFLMIVAKKCSDPRVKALTREVLEAERAVGRK